MDASLGDARRPTGVQCGDQIDRKRAQLRATQTALSRLSFQTNDTAAVATAPNPTARVTAGLVVTPQSSVADVIRPMSTAVSPTITSAATTKAMISSATRRGRAWCVAQCGIDAE